MSIGPDAVGRVSDAVRPQRRLNRFAGIRRSGRIGVRFGLRRGRDDTSAMPSSPRGRYRTHPFLRGGWRELETFSGRRSAQPCSMTRVGELSRALFIRSALA